MQLIFLIFASVITFTSVFPYLKDIIRGSTRPNIVSWITWTLLTAIATIAELVGGETATAIFTLSATMATLLVVLFGLRYGYTKYSRFDVWCQVGALLGFVLWWIFNSPVLAIVAAVIIDFIGTLPTIVHSWKSPKEETWITYSMTVVGALFTILALTSFNWSSLSYPVYIILINSLLSVTILVRRKFKAYSKIEQP